MYSQSRQFLSTANSLELARHASHDLTNSMRKAATSSTKLKKVQLPEKYLAVDAQLVFADSDGGIPVPVRVSITDYHGRVLLDTFVRPSQPVVDYRFAITGLRSECIMNAPPFSTVQRQVASMINGKIIVGYMLWRFLSLLEIPHPAFDTRDVAVFGPFQRGLKCKQILPLSVLINRLMGRNVGYGYEHPLENARAALDLFRSCEQLWENIIQSGSWPSLLPPSAYKNFFS